MKMPKFWPRRKLASEGGCMARNGLGAALGIPVLLLGLILGSPGMAQNSDVKRLEYKEYEKTVHALREAARRGAFPTVKPREAVEFESFNAAFQFVASQHQPYFLGRTDVEELESRNKWWVSGIRADGSADMYVFLFNHTRVRLQGVIFELGDEGCKERESTRKTFYVWTLPESSLIEPRSPVLLRLGPTLHPTSEILMHEGLVCGTVVGAWYSERQLVPVS